MNKTDIFRNYPLNLVPNLISVSTVFMYVHSPTL